MPPFRRSVAMPSGPHSCQPSPPLPPAASRFRLSCHGGMILRPSRPGMTVNALYAFVDNQEKAYSFICKYSFSSLKTHYVKVPYDEETVKRLGWKSTLLVAVGLTFVAFNIFPLMGDSLIRQSVALLRAKDPLLKRSGAYRLSLIATNDGRRRRIVEAGGIIELVKMLESASDDKTCREAVKALSSLSSCDLAIKALDDTGVERFVRDLAVTSADVDVQRHSFTLLKRLDSWKEGRSQ